MRHHDLVDADAPALHPELVPISSLTLDPKNARKHSERNLGVIGYSLGKFQQVKPIVVHRRTKIIIAGNGTLTEALEMGAEKIVAVMVDKVRGPDGELREMTDAEAAELAILDNRSAELAEWDVEQLAATIGEMPELEWDAAGWEAPDFEGFDVDWPIAEVTTVGEHERRLQGPDAPALGPSTNPADEWVGMPEFQHIDKTAHRTLLVHFRTDEDIAAFAEVVDQSITPKTRFLWYPYIIIETTADKVYKDTTDE